MRPRTAIVLTATAAVISACTTTGGPVPAPVAVSAESVPSQTKEGSGPPMDLTQPSADLACADYIDTQPPTGDFEVVAGVVALPPGPGHAALQASGAAPGAAEHLFAKTGLLIRAGASFDLVVPETVGDRVAVQWGSPGVPTRRLTVSACHARGGADATWLTSRPGRGHPTSTPP